jgi:hypothetical protein
MQIDAARAPFVATPAYYGARNGRDGDRGGPDDNGDRGGPSCAAGDKGMERSMDDCERRLTELQDCVRRQMEQMQRLQECLDRSEAALQGAAQNSYYDDSVSRLPDSSPLPPRPEPSSETRWQHGPRQSGETPVFRVQPPQARAPQPFPVQPSSYYRELRPVPAQRTAHGEETSEFMSRLPPVD